MSTTTGVPAGGVAPVASTGARASGSAARADARLRTLTAPRRRRNPAPHAWCAISAAPSSRYTSAPLTSPATSANARRASSTRSNGPTRERDPRDAPEGATPDSASLWNIHTRERTARDAHTRRLLFREEANAHRVRRPRERRGCRLIESHSRKRRRPPRQQTFLKPGVVAPEKHLDVTADRQRRFESEAPITLGRAPARPLTHVHEHRTRCPLAPISPPPSSRRSRPARAQPPVPPGACPRPPVRRMVSDVTRSCRFGRASVLIDFAMKMRVFPVSRAPRLTAISPIDPLLTLISGPSSAPFPDRSPEVPRLIARERFEQRDAPRALSLPTAPYRPRWTKRRLR